MNLDRTRVADIKALAGLTKLWRLFLNLNQISDLGPLAGLRNLMHLSLVHNRIVDISPLAGLTNLTYLDLGNLAGWELPGNQITDISPLAGMAKMQSLALPRNRVRNISALAGLTELQVLSLEGNPLDGKAGAVYIPMIKLNNPGINLSYDACLGRVYTLTISATAGGSVTKPGEGAFICNEGESVYIDDVSIPVAP